MSPSTPAWDPALLRENERFVRSVARALVTDEHAAEDVVQETQLAHVRRGDLPTNAIRAWLGRVARNLAFRSRREAARRDRRERAAARDERVPSADEILERENLRRRVVEALLAVEEPYRSALLLRYYEDVPPREIAKRTGAPVETVRTRLKRGLERLRLRLDADHGGDRAAWCAPLTALAGSLGVQPLPAALGVVAALLLAGYFAWPDPSAQPEHAPAPTKAVRPDAFEATAPGVGPSPPALPRVTSPSRTAVRAVTTGSVLVDVTWVEDGTPAAGTPIHLWPHAPAVEGSLQWRLARADESGRARFDAVPIGMCSIEAESEAQWIDVAPGAEASARISVAGSKAVEGLVVDASGEPVEGADVWVQGYGIDGIGDFLARTSEDGRFRLRCRRLAQTIGARAAGHSPSQIESLTKPDLVGVTLRLGGPGGEIRGRVLSPTGDALPHAAVLLAGREPAPDRWPPYLSEHALEIRADGEGAFVFPGVAPGPAIVWARASGFGPASATTEVGATAGADVAIVLPIAGTVAGRVFLADGEPAAGVTVRYAGVRQGVSNFIGSSEVADAEGRYRLTGLAPGETEIHAGGTSEGRTRGTVTVISGGEAQRDLMLEPPRSIEGRIVDERGVGLPGLHVEARPNVEGPEQPGESRVRQSKSWVEGRFSVADCEESSYRVVVTNVVRDLAVAEDVRPGAGEIVLTVPKESLPSVFVRGCVVRPDGTGSFGPPRPQVSVLGPLGGRIVEVEPESGAFQVGPLPPDRYEVSVTSRSYPKLDLGSRELAAGETWDLGTVTLECPCWIVATLHRPVGVPSELVGIGLSDGSRPLSVPLAREGDEFRFGPLRAGRYWLFAGGTGIAATAVPVTVDDEEESRVDVRAVTGIEVGFDLARIVEAAGIEKSISLTVRDASGIVVAFGLIGYSGIPRAPHRLWFLPGRYEIAAVITDGPTATARLEVPEPPARTEDVVLVPR